MAKEYFQNFPTMVYGNVACVDVTRRVVINPAFPDRPTAYYPYQIPAGERPDTVALDYYGDSGMDWLVWESGRVQDPYYSWPMDQDSFQEFVEAKYGGVANAQQLILFWRVAWADDDTTLAPSGFASLPEPLKKYYQPDYGEGTRVVAYTRGQQDWTASTNMVVTFQVANGAGFQVGETVALATGNTNWANAVVASANSSALVVMHVLGDVTANGGITGANLEGEVSEAVTNALGFSYTSNCIPVDERPFWAPVYAWDLEVERNEDRKFTVLVDSKYASTIWNQLRKDLGT